jgi:transcriptional regulator with XRE-family HTH domain
MRVDMRIAEEIRREIGSRLREARLKVMKTQKQVADAVGLSRQMINRYENGHDAPTAENLAHILDYLRTGIHLSTFGLRLTAEDLGARPVGPQLVPKQLVLELDKPYDLENANVRILRRGGSIEIIVTQFVPMAG